MFRLTVSHARSEIAMEKGLWLLDTTGKHNLKCSSVQGKRSLQCRTCSLKRVGYEGNGMRGSARGRKMFTNSQTAQPPNPTHHPNCSPTMKGIRAILVGVGEVYVGESIYALGFKGGLLSFPRSTFGTLSICGSLGFHCLATLKNTKPYSFR